MLNTKNSLGTNFNQVNTAIRQLEREQVVKTFKQPGGNAITDGRYADGRYGGLYSNPNNDRSMLIGQHPDDGHVGIWIVKDNLDVIDELS